MFTSPAMGLISQKKSFKKKAFKIIRTINLFTYPIKTNHRKYNEITAF